MNGFKNLKKNDKNEWVQKSIKQKDENDGFKNLKKKDENEWVQHLKNKI